MKNYTANSGLAFTAGAVLAGMIAINSQLAGYSSPLLASWLAHGIGAAAAAMIMVMGLMAIWLGWTRLPLGTTARKVSTVKRQYAPYWAYLAGIPGAFTVILAAVTVNSGLGLATTIGLIMAGQVVFSLLSDTLGWFGLEPKSFSVTDGLSLTNVVVS